MLDLLVSTVLSFGLGYFMSILSDLAMRYVFPVAVLYLVTADCDCSGVGYVW
eukprot:SAG25_NODE_882_length_4969_cov_14.148049_2_plen_52_part_00